MSHEVEAALRALQSGGVIVFPTETLYGLGCDARDESALRRLFALKGRAAQGEAFKPPPVLVRDEEMLAAWAVVSPQARDLMERFWPGALTIVLPACANVSDLLCGTDAAGRHTLGVRASSQPLARELVTRLGAPLVATSANLSGAQAEAALPRRLQDVPLEMREGADALLDGGEVGGTPSTVVDCSVVPPRVLRRGALEIGSQS